MNPAAIRDKLFAYGGYTSFFMFAFVISAYYTFPYERLRELIPTQLGFTGEQDSMKLTIGDVRPSWLTGVKLSDVTLQRAPSLLNPSPAPMHLDKVSVSLSALSLISSTKKINLAADVGDGSLEGNVTVDAATQRVQEANLDLNELDLHELGAGGYAGIPLKGKATGNLTFAFAEEPTKSTGDVTLKIAGLHVGDGKAKIKAPGMPSGLTLDEVDAGTLELHIVAQDGAATLERFTSNGRDLAVGGEGAVQLGTPLLLSRVNLTLELKFSDVYKNKSDRTKSLFELLGMQAEWRRALAPDGTLRLHVGGTVMNLRAAGSSTGISHNKTSRKAAKLAGSH